MVLLLFVYFCASLWGEMETLVRVVISVFAVLVACVVIGLVVLITRFCGVGRGGRRVNMKRYIMCWVAVIVFILAICITVPGCGLTLFEFPEPEEHHFDWDWDWD